MEPPFSEKKKYEFPDAFTLETIENWCIKNNTKAYFVSGDTDCKDFAEKSNNIECLTNLSELINIVRSDYEENYKKFIDSFENNIDLIKTTIFNYHIFAKSIKEITVSKAIFEVSINNTILINSDKMGLVETKRYLLSFTIMLESQILGNEVIYKVVNKHISIEIPFFSPI